MVVASHHLRLFGEFRLERADGSPIDMRSKKARALLIHLVLHPRSGDTRERLASLLWGEMGDNRARANLRQTISTLRGQLDDPDGLLIASDDAAVRIKIEAIEVDVLRFCRLSRETTDRDRAIQAYDGELLPGFLVGEEAFDEWLESERTRLVHVASDLFEQVVAARREAGDNAAAQEVLSRWLLLEPAREEAHRALMELYASTGRRSKALEQFELCKEALAKSYGVPPSDAMVALQARLREPIAGSRTTSLGKTSIAVLPFESLTGPADTYFSDGIAEDVIVGLSKFERITVIARQSSFVFRSRAVDILEIGARLGVHYVLHGSLRRAEGRLRIAVHLADAATGASVWAHRYDAETDDVFRLVDEITRVIVSTLANRVEADRMARTRKKPTSSLEAYDCLLKAKYHHHRYSDEDNRIAEECLARALELDPEFALTHAWMACVVAQGGSFRSPSPGAKTSYDYAKEAEKYDEESETHRILAACYLTLKEFEQAEHHQRRALELNPNDDRIICQMGEILAFLGNPGEAIPWIEQAMRLNPYHHDGFYYDHGHALYHLGRDREALESLLRIGAPRFSHHAFLAAICGRLGDRSRALFHLDRAKHCKPTFSAESFARALPYREPSFAERLIADLRSLKPSR